MARNAAMPRYGWATAVGAGGHRGHVLRSQGLDGRELTGVVALQVLEEFRSHTGDKRRLFVDGLEGFRAASIYPNRMRLFFAALINQLRVHDVTTIFSEELSLSLQESVKNELTTRFSAQVPETEIATIAESAVWLRPIEVDARVFRLLSVMKMRESAYTPELREFEIGHGGIRVAPSSDSAKALLAASRLAGTSARGSAD